MATDPIRAIEHASNVPVPFRAFSHCLANQNPRQIHAFCSSPLGHGDMFWARRTYATIEAFPRNYATRCAMDRPRRSPTRLVALPAAALASMLTLGFPQPLIAVETMAARPAVTSLVAKHESIGHRIAADLKRHGIPDEAVVFTVSALPVVELRGGIPLGFMFRMNPYKVFALAVAGNMLPVFGILAFLRLGVVRGIARPFLDRARRLASSIGDTQSVATALALFVGVPLPGTGAFTGTLIAFVLDMPTKTAVASVGAGVVMAACIMTLLSAMGKWGAAIAIMAMLVVGGLSIIRRSRPGSFRSNVAVDESSESGLPASQQK